MSLSDLQKFIILAETDTSMKADLKPIVEALDADAAELDDADLNVLYEKLISLAASKDLNVVLDDFDEWDAQAGEDESKDEMSEGFELTDEELEAVAGGRRRNRRRRRSGGGSRRGGGRRRVRAGRGRGGGLGVFGHIAADLIVRAVTPGTDQL